MSVITVTNTNDDGAGSLRDVIAHAGAGDTIVFAAGVTSVTLNSPLVIAQDVDVNADYAHDDGKFSIYGSVIVQKGSTVTLEHLHIEANSTGADASTAGDDPHNAQPGLGGSYGQSGSSNPNNGAPGGPGTDGGAGGDATQSSGVSTSAGPALENDGNLTLVQCSIVGTAKGGSGADGADGGDGGYGGTGGGGSAGFQGNSGGHGGDGGLGGDGGEGSSGTSGSDAVAGIINTGDLTLIDTAVTGQAQGGDGGSGGDGGDGGDGGGGNNGGSGSLGGFSGISNGGDGGNGADGGSGGTGGDGANGGSAVGGILNTGTVHVVGGAVLGGDSATAGKGGDAGSGGAAGPGGTKGLGGQGMPRGSDGMVGTDGSDGSEGAAGADGTETPDYADYGTTDGTLTINGRIFDLDPDLSSQPTTVSVSSGSPVTFTFDARSLNGAMPTDGSVGWQVVTGPDGPALDDFVGATSGVLSFTSTDGISDQTFSVELTADAASPRDESFTVELIDPDTGNVIGSVGSLTQNVTNLDAPLCFVSSTRIATDRGDIAVEELRVGDVAVTASGAPRPIIWIGSRDVDCAAQAVPSQSWPVRIRAGAFGGALPERDLRLSPGHPVLVGDHLVPIMCLVNGTSITRVPVDRVAYWHVELDRHDILLAEGLAAESFFDLGTRAWFETEADDALSHPDLIAPGCKGRCRTIAIDGPIVEAERRRVDALFATSLMVPCAWPSAADTAVL